MDVTRNESGIRQTITEAREAIVDLAVAKADIDRTNGVLSEVVRRAGGLPLLAFQQPDGSIELVETDPDAITITESIWIAPDGTAWPVAEIEVPA